MIAVDLDVGRYQVPDGRIAAPEHHVFARRFQVIVLDQEGPPAVPDEDRLRVMRAILEILKIGVLDEDLVVRERRALAGIGHQPVLGAVGWRAREGAPVERDVMRQLRGGRLAVAAQQHQRVEPVVRGEPDADEAVVMSASRR